MPSHEKRRKKKIGKKFVPGYAFLRAVLMRRDLTISARALYALLYCYSDYDKIFVSNRRLSKILGRSLRTIKYLLDELETACLIKRTSRLQGKKRRIILVRAQIEYTPLKHGVAKITDRNYNGTSKNYCGKRVDLQKIAFRLSPYAWLVYSLLRTVAKLGTIRAGNDLLANYLGISVSYIEKALNELESAVLIERTGRTRDRIITLICPEFIYDR